MLLVKQTMDAGWVRALLFSVFIQCLVGGGSISKFSGGSNLVDPKGFMNGNISNLY